MDAIQHEIQCNFTRPCPFQMHSQLLRLDAKFAVFYTLSNLTATSILLSPIFVDGILRVKAFDGSIMRRLMLPKQKAREHSNCVAVQACIQSDCSATIIRTYYKNARAEVDVHTTLSERYTVDDDRSTQLARRCNGVCEDENN
jgi:hypothetical protein